jgi:hypothetical protein
LMELFQSSLLRYREFVPGSSGKKAQHWQQASEDTVVAHTGLIRVHRASAGSSLQEGISNLILNSNRPATPLVKSEGRSGSSGYL